MASPPTPESRRGSLAALFDTPKAELVFKILNTPPESDEELEENPMNRKDAEAYAEANFYIPLKYVLGRSNLESEPYVDTYLKYRDTQAAWPEGKGFFPVYGDYVDISDDIVIPKIMKLNTVWKKKFNVTGLIKEIHLQKLGDGDKPSDSDRLWLTIALEVGKWRNSKVPQFIAEEVGKLMDVATSEAKLAPVPCIVWEDSKESYVPRPNTTDEVVEMAPGATYAADNTPLLRPSVDTHHTVREVRRHLEWVMGGGIGQAYVVKNPSEGKRLRDGSSAIVFSSEEGLMLLLTCSHVFPGPQPDQEYIHGGPSAKRRMIQIPGASTTVMMQEKLDKILKDQTMVKDVNKPRAIPESSQFSAKAKRAYEEAVETLEQAEALQVELKRFNSMKSRIAGYVVYSSGLRPVSGENFSIDIAAAIIDKAGAENFRNGIYIGIEHPREKIISWLQTGVASNPVPKFEGPEKNFLRIQPNKYVSQGELRRPKYVDDHDNAVLPIVKLGRTTNDTVGVITGAVTHRELDVGGDTFWVEEIVAYQYMEGKHYYSQKGDSGSMSLTVEGYSVGVVNGGSAESMKLDKTYHNPAWHLFEKTMPYITSKVPDLKKTRWVMV